MDFEKVDKWAEAQVRLDSMETRWIAEAYLAVRRENMMLAPVTYRALREEIEKLRAEVERLRDLIVDASEAYEASDPLRIEYRAILASRAILAVRQKDEKK